jgi:glycosyltransferase involved in cell wall biosynthesis
MRRRPLLLTEHGIYVKERMLEISQSDWIYEAQDAEASPVGELSYFKRMWIRMFHLLARMTYETADAICTLFEGNRDLQVQYGADTAKIEIVPNGIWPEAYAELPRPGAGRQPTVALIGRVVPIKDVKTFIKAVKLVTQSVPAVRALIVGPDEEDPDYAGGCRQLTNVLGLKETVTFTGRQDVKRIYPDLDVLVLTSISEGLPLVILEGSAAGVPVVATDVGACRELLMGRTTEDRALGPSGIVTGLLNPTETARAMVRLLTRPADARHMGTIGMERVRRFYNQGDVLARYRGLYEDLQKEYAPWPA